jgi:hypothetical protein
MQTELPEHQHYAQEKRCSCVAWFLKMRGGKEFLSEIRTSTAMLS